MFFVIEFSKFKTALKKLIYGIIIGASMMVPGFSGGTAAIILGIFYDIINSASNLLTEFKKSFKFLLPYAFGGIIGIFLVCVPLNFVIIKYQIYFSFFVIGIILGSIGCFLPESKIKLNRLVWVIAGSIPVIFQQLTNEKIINTNNYFLVIIVGILSSIALILPGISLTNILLSFGCYEKLINSVINFDFIYLTVYGFSLIAGILISIKIILKLYTKYTEKINLILLGMVLSSISQIYISFPKNEQMIPCLLLLVGGITLSLLMRRFEK